MPHLFSFPLAQRILNLVCVYSKLERQEGNITVQYPVWKDDLMQDDDLMDCFDDQNNAFLVMINVEVVEILDVFVEYVEAGERVGAFTENGIKKLKEPVARPVFKCKIHERHRRFFVAEYIIIDVEQLTVDSYSREMLMMYIETVQETFGY